MKSKDWKDIENQQTVGWDDDVYYDLTDEDLEDLEDALRKSELDKAFLAFIEEQNAEFERQERLETVADHIFADMLYNPTEEELLEAYKSMDSMDEVLCASDIESYDDDFKYES